MITEKARSNSEVIADEKRLSQQFTDLNLEGLYVAIRDSKLIAYDISKDALIKGGVSGRPPLFEDPEEWVDSNNGVDPKTDTIFRVGIDIDRF